MRGEKPVELRTAEPQDGRRRKIFRRRLMAGWLAIIAAGPAVAITIAHDVPETALAAVLLHLARCHPAEIGVLACRQPQCDAVSLWRAPAPPIVCQSAVTA